MHDGSLVSGYVKPLTGAVYNKSLADHLVDYSPKLLNGCFQRRVRFLVEQIVSPAARIIDKIRSRIFYQP